MRPWIALLCAGAGLAGCSLFIETDNLATESSTTTDASSGGESGADAPSSGGSSGSDGAGSGGTDASTPDADAGPVPDTGPDIVRLGFCEGLSPAPTLCSDFDTNEFPSGWDQLYEWGVCSPTLDSGDSVSEPRSFLITTPALTMSSQQGGGSLLKAFPKPASSITIELDVRFEIINNPDWLDVVNIETDGPSGTANYVLRVREGEAQISEVMYPTAGGTLYDGHPFPTAPVAGQWMHIRWTHTYAGTSSFSNVTVDGATAGGGLHLDEYAGPLAIRVGVVYVQGVSGPWNVRIDNLVVDLD